MLFLNKLPRISQLVLLGITIIIGILFFTGSSNEISINDTAYSEPKHTNLLIIWTYILVALAVGSTLLFQFGKFILKATKEPKSALLPVGVVVGAVLLLLITYSLGDGTPLNLPGYDGKENVESWLKFTDMLLYIIYILGIAAGSLILFGGAFKLLKK